MQSTVESTQGVLGFRDGRGGFLSAAHETSCVELSGVGDLVIANQDAELSAQTVRTTVQQPGRLESNKQIIIGD
jgi:hypothetical protein